MSPDVHGFYDPATHTISYLVVEPGGGRGLIIDSVRDFDAASGRTATRAAERVLAAARGVKIEAILETHVHADHLTAAPYLKERLGAPIGIGARVTVVQETFGALFNAGPEFATDGRQFDRLFEDGARFTVGDLTVEVMATPGHTPACVTYVIGDAAFVGDTLFRPDYGTARTDFPGGDARTLYRSIRRILALPPATRLFLCHDYPPEGGAPCWQTTVAEERAHNVHIRDGIDEDAFVAMREARDATLAMPALLLPSVQVNMRAGHLPPPEDNGISYLKLPVDAI